MCLGTIVTLTWPKMFLLRVQIVETMRTVHWISQDGNDLRDWPTEERENVLCQQGCQDKLSRPSKRMPWSTKLVVRFLGIFKKQMNWIKKMAIHFERCASEGNLLTQAKAPESPKTIKSSNACCLWLQVWFEKKKSQIGSFRKSYPTILHSNIACSGMVFVGSAQHYQFAWCHSTLQARWDNRQSHR